MPLVYDTNTRTFIEPQPLPAFPCRKCAREIKPGQHCTCVASKPYHTHDKSGNRRAFVVTV